MYVRLSDPFKMFVLQYKLTMKMLRKTYKRFDIMTSFKRKFYITHRDKKYVHVIINSQPHICT